MYDFWLLFTEQTLKKKIIFVRSFFKDINKKKFSYRFKSSK